MQDNFLTKVKDNESKSFNKEKISRLQDCQAEGKTLYHQQEESKI